MYAVVCYDPRRGRFVLQAARQTLHVIAKSNGAGGTAVATYANEIIFFVEKAHIERIFMRSPSLLCRRQSDRCQLQGRILQNNLRKKDSPKDHSKIATCRAPMLTFQRFWPTYSRKQKRFKLLPVRKPTNDTSLIRPTTTSPTCAVYLQCQ